MGYFDSKRDAPNDQSYFGSLGAAPATVPPGFAFGVPVGSPDATSPVVPPGLDQLQRQNQWLAQRLDPSTLAALAVRASPLGSLADMQRYREQTADAIDQRQWGDAASSALQAGQAGLVLGSWFMAMSPAEVWAFLRGGGWGALSNETKASLGVGGAGGAPLPAFGDTPSRADPPAGGWPVSDPRWRSPPLTADPAKVPSAPTALDQLTDFLQRALETR